MSKKVTKTMQHIAVGQLVKLATMPEMIFIVTTQNPDGSFAIEEKTAQGYGLKYGHVPQEMLRLVPVNSLGAS